MADTRTEPVKRFSIEVPEEWLIKNGHHLHLEGFTGTVGYRRDYADAFPRNTVILFGEHASDDVASQAAVAKLLMRIPRLAPRRDEGPTAGAVGPVVCYGGRRRSDVSVEPLGLRDGALSGCATPRRASGS